MFDEKSLEKMPKGPEEITKPVEVIEVREEAIERDG
jgi:hypothetical protein